MCVGAFCPDKRKLCVTFQCSHVCHSNQLAFCSAALVSISSLRSHQSTIVTRLQEVAHKPSESVAAWALTYTVASCLQYFDDMYAAPSEGGPGGPLGSCVICHATHAAAMYRSFVWLHR